jgi:hypothetical protein
MGSLRIFEHDEPREFALTNSVCVGRHWSNDVVLTTDSAPLNWLELRWRPPHWCWRVLTATDRTRGSGAASDDGWRVWTGSGGHVRLDGGPSSVQIELVDTAPPELIVERLTRPGRFAGPLAARFVEVRPDGRVWPLGIEPTEAPPLRDGQVFVLGLDALRLHLATSVSDTAPITLDLRDPALELQVDLPRLHATFSLGASEAVATGECVRVLAAYALARQSDGDAGGGGWMPAVAAHSAWIELGGRSESPIDRLAWERGKLRTQLANQGVSGIDQLFDLRRSGGLTEVRLAVSPARIFVVDV